MSAFAHLPRMAYEAGDDDHTLLRRYRRITPLAVSPNGFPLALRHAHLDLLTNPETTRQLETEVVVTQGITDGPIFDLYRTSMLFSNGGDHARRRGPVARTFAFKLMEAMRTEVATLAEDLVRERMTGEAFDYLDEYAGEIPARIIGSVLGVPRGQMERFRRLVYSVTRSFVISNAVRARSEVEADFTELHASVAELVAARRASPREDFLSDYVASADDRGDLSEAEIRWQIVSVIIGGVDTTRLALCGTLSHLLRHPEQWRAFCADPDGLKKAVAQEGLRVDPPIASFGRVAIADVDLGGTILPKGAPVSVSTLSALRDEEVYVEADRFDISRTDHPKWHPVFGAGAHRCLGEALARVELEESLAAIARLAPETVVIDHPGIRGVNGIRTIDRMTVRFA